MGPGRREILIAGKSCEAKLVAVTAGMGTPLNALGIVCEPAANPGGAVPLLQVPPTPTYFWRPKVKTLQGNLPQA